MASRCIVYWPDDLRASTGTIYGWWDESHNAACVIGVHQADPTNTQHALARARHDLVVLATYDHASAADLFAIAGSGRIVIITRNAVPCDVCFYHPPNARRKAFLSIDGIANSLETSRPMHPVIKNVQQQEQADFTKAPCQSTSLRWAVERMNRCQAVRRAVRDGGALRTTPAPGEICKTGAAPARDHRWALLIRSATLRQIALRYRQIASPREQILADGTHDIAYIRSYSTYWLIANDVIVGVTLAAILQENSGAISAALDQLLRRYVIDGVRTVLLSLNDWPGGLKLNSELGGFFNNAFLWFLSAWDEFFLARLNEHLPKVIGCIALSAYLGGAFALSALSDLAALASLHLYVFHFMIASIYRAHVGLIYALWNVFRGKKYNTLRNRIEPSDYELDQLLIGTILFTLAVFLFPTVFVYHVVCAMFRMGSIGVQAILELGLAGINHFPLFAVLLRVKEAGRLPGGVRFPRLATPNQAGDAIYLKLENQPIGFGRIFSEQRLYLRTVLSHYAEVPGRIASGRLVRPYTTATGRN